MGYTLLKSTDGYNVYVFEDLAGVNAFLKTLAPNCMGIRHDEKINRWTVAVRKTTR